MNAGVAVVASSGARDLAGVLGDDAGLRTDADLIEIRLDRFSDPLATDLAALVTGLRRPAIFTLRPRAESGEYTGTLEQRIALHRHADAAGFAWLDLEADVATALPRGRAKRLISWHGTELDSSIASRIAELAKLDADAVKVAANAECPHEALRFVRNASAAGRELGIPVIAIAMGDPGAWLRPLAGKFGMPWVYAAIHESKKTAAGQFTVDSALDRYRIRTVGPNTKVFAVVGSNVRRSWSPRVHNAVFHALGTDAIYVDISAPEFATLARIAEELPLAGLSVTTPFKGDAFEFAFEKDESAQRIAAANTLVRREDGRFRARNTDIDGFRAAIELAVRRPEFCRTLTVGHRTPEDHPYRELRFDPALPFGRRIERALVYGTGGAARAAARALLDQGARVYVTGRDPAGVLSLVLAVGGGCEAISEGRATSLSFDLLVKAIPDLPNDDLPLDPLDFAPEGFAADVVYQPVDTAFLRAARANGRTPVPGSLMFAAQAALQDHAFLGIDPKAALQAIDSALMTRA